MNEKTDKIKIHINLSSGVNGVVIQRSTNKKYVTVCWNDLATCEQKKISTLFHSLASIYSETTTENMKKCTKCGRVLPLNMFYKRFNKKGINVGASVCKECRIAAANERNRIHRQNRTQEQLEKQREYNRKYQKLYYLENTATPPPPVPKKEDTTPKPVEKQCKHCVKHDICFPGNYIIESNFANTCKKYDENVSS